jgi:tRNA modification GTPase
MSPIDSDTICAIATPPGRSGVGVIRVSGPLVQSIASTVLGLIPKPRHAHYATFLDESQVAIDQGIALYFNKPNSFTGEDILELQGHGGIHVLNILRDRILNAGARLARPGEFSERAFLNNKIDLLQAEAIADLIDASSQQAAKSAMRTLQGDFSRRIFSLLEQLIGIRVNVEAAIDFSDEDIDLLSDHKVKESLAEVLVALKKVFAQAQQGALLKDGINVVIAGKPNAGKSSLLNALSGHDSAIVTNIPGTTRDILSEEISIDGMPVHIVDTAGLRSSEDIVEQEGVKRARSAMAQADQILLLVDKTDAGPVIETLLEELGLLNDIPLANNANGTNSGFIDDGAETKLSMPNNIVILFNKIDLISGEKPIRACTKIFETEVVTISISAKEQLGIKLIWDYLKTSAGFLSGEEGSFVARARHLAALKETESLLNSAQLHIKEGTLLELVAEDLRLAQSELGKITGAFTNDDLLGEIFSNFCVGK